MASGTGPGSQERFSAKLSRVGRSVEASKTLAVTAMAKRLKAEGKDVLSLTAGEPDFQTPAEVARAGIDAIESGATRYTAAAGEPELRAAIADSYAARWGVELTGANVCASSGAKPLLYYLISVLANPGDEVIFPRPFWVSYEAMVKMREATVVPVDTRHENGLRLAATELDSAVTPNSKILLLNNPTNPTGAVYSRDELLGIAEVARDRDLIVIADEIYENLVLGDGLEQQSMFNLAPWMRERTVVVSGMSKSYAMTGWRLGYAIADEALIEPLTRYQSQALSSPSQISQRAALAALRSDGSSLKAMREAFDRRRRYCIERMSALGLPFIEPQGAFYLFFDVGELCAARGWLDGQDFCTRALEAEGLAFIPGDAFGMSDWVRLSFAVADEVLADAFTRLERFLTSC